MINQAEVEKLVTSIVKKYVGRGCKEEVLFEAGMKGAKNALDRYKDKPNYDFCKDWVFVWFIRNEITKTIIDSQKGIIIPDEMIEKIIEFENIRKSQSELNLEEIASKMNISLEEVSEVQEVIENVKKMEI